MSILQACEEWDAGPIFATREFAVPAPAVSKSQLYRQEVTEAAVAAVLEALEKLQTPGFAPQPLDYSRADVRGTLQPPMRPAASLALRATGVALPPTVRQLADV